MNTLIAIVLGITIGFLIEWVVDWIYWRGKASTLESQLNELQKGSKNMENEISVLREENQHLKEIFGVPMDEGQESPGEDEQILQDAAASTVLVPEFIEEEEQEEGEAQEEPEQAEDVQEPAPVEDITEATEDIREVEIIGADYGEKLRAIGINTPLDLLKRGSTSQGRAEITEQVGISQTQLLEWINHAELYQIKGMVPEYANNLKEAGVDTAVDLATQDPQDLHEKLVAAYAKKTPDAQPPSEEQVQDWIKQANSLPNVATYMALRSKQGS